MFWGLAASPYLVFLFRQFFAAIPRDLEGAAIIDGCGYGRIFLPLSVLLTSFLLSFTWMWGDYPAAAALYVVPVMVVFLVAQRYFVRSVATSGVKG